MDLDMSTGMSRRNLLICFDAFGTLFTPKRPVVQQYGEVASSLGLGGWTDEELQASFKTAFKNESKDNPNYGKASGMDAEKWWTNIITNTFHPFLSKTSNQRQQLPPDLAPTLLHRFWSKEGYTLYPDVQPLIQKLRHHYKNTNGHIVVGVITNSDPRVPDVLSSLGLRVSPVRWGREVEDMSSTLSLSAVLSEDWDVDFSVMSYDVGYEKPDRRIFDAADGMVGRILKDRKQLSKADDGPEMWRMVYVGDEYEKDVVGALNAGWNAVLIDRENPGKLEKVRWLDDEAVGKLEEIFESSGAVGFSSLAKLAEWMPDIK